MSIALQTIEPQDNTSQEFIQRFMVLQKRLRDCLDYENETLNESDTLTSILKELGEVLNTDRCILIQLDENLEALPIQLEYRRDETVPPLLGIPPPWRYCPFLIEAEMTRQLSYTSDTLRDVRVQKLPDLCEFFQLKGIRGGIAYPIIRQEKLLSVLVVHSLTPREWQPEDLLFTTVAADQIALTMVLTRKNQAEEAVRRSEERYHSLYQWEKKTREVLQQVRQPLEIRDIFSTVVQVMSEALNLDRCFIIEFDTNKQVLPVQYEYRSDESVKAFTGMCPPWDFCPYLAKSAQNETSWSEDTFVDELFKGNEQWHLFSRKYDVRAIVAAPILYEDRLINVLVMHNVTPRKWTEQELFLIQIVTDQISTGFYQAKVKDQLIKTSMMKSQFLATMSHELRTPLNSVIGYSEMLEGGLGGALNEKQMKYASNISRSGRHLLDLVNEILDLAKIEAGKTTLSVEWINMASFIAEKKILIEGLARGKNISLHFDRHPQLVQVQADLTRLRQIFLNLLSNAVKYNQQDGSIFLRLYLAEDMQHWVCEVEDTGIGVASDKLKSVFDEFYQVDNSYSREFEGTGLGLSVTKKLIELHGGKLWVESELGVGSKFTFELPVMVS
jgi:signal transduction histidine kinase